MCPNHSVHNQDDFNDVFIRFYRTGLHKPKRGWGEDLGENSSTSHWSFGDSGHQ